MSFTLWAEPVRTPGAIASNPTSPAVESDLKDIEYRDIFGPPYSMNSGAEGSVPPELKVSPPGYSG
jgi:hypothetical protein